jgi:GNAT superfamily N-acetyltransferase
MYLDEKPVTMIAFGNSRYFGCEEALIEIWRIHILPLFWRQGIGTELMKWGINEIRRL